MSQDKVPSTILASFSSCSVAAPWIAHQQRDQNHPRVRLRGSVKRSKKSQGSSTKVSYTLPPGLVTI